MKFNWSAVARIIGYGLLFFGVTLCLPTIAAFACGEFYCVRGFVISILICSGFGTL